MVAVREIVRAVLYCVHMPVTVCMRYVTTSVCV